MCVTDHALIVRCALVRPPDCNASIGRLKEQRAMPALRVDLPKQWGEKFKLGHAAHKWAVLAAGLIISTYSVRTDLHSTDLHHLCVPVCVPACVSLSHSGSGVHATQH